MCGITGFVDYKNTTTKETLRLMTDVLTHRGPDSRGDYLSQKIPQVGLGHRRLSILDLSELGAQPMEYNQYQLVFNGEIYNYKEISIELTALGHRFISNSDSEVILHAYDEWGENCVQKFIGMFAFVIYDNKKNICFCARDRAGIKPFYYYLAEDLFLFASELKSIVQHPRFVKQLDLNAVNLYLQYGNVPAPHCIYKNTKKLPPAHTATFHLDNKSLELKKYWDIYQSYGKQKVDLPFEEAKTKTEQVLEKAFEYRMVADVPIGIFLSGGYDSSCLTALLQKNRTQKLKTFTVGVPDIGLNEAPAAKKIAAHLGTEHQEIMCSGEEAIKIVKELPYYFDEPFADSSAIPTILVSRTAKENVTVALSADGGDEQFAGYNRYAYLMKYGKILDRLPAALKKTVGFAMQKLPASAIPFSNNIYNFENRYEKIKMLLVDSSTKNIMLSLSQQFTDNNISDLLIQKVEILKSAYDRSDLLKPGSSPLDYMMALDYETYLADDILQKVDRASMSASLEAREPFLDHHIGEWAAQLPDHFKYHNGTKKYIIKQIVHQYIPIELFSNRKMGFAIPIEKWLYSELRDQVEYFLNDSYITQQGIFKKDAINDLKTKFYSGRKEFGVKIWYLLSFQMWYDKWIK